MNLKRIKPKYNINHGKNNGTKNSSDKLFQNSI